MEIVKLKKEHIKEALGVVWSVFKEFEAPDYSEEGIREFRSFIDYDCMVQRFCKEEILLWGCLDNHKLVGVIGTKGISHISLLFVDKKYHRQGIGRELFQVVKDFYKKENAIEKITVNSAPYAVDFYHKIGFLDTDIEQNINGIRFIPMNYYLK